MSQELRVVQCYKCETYQVDIVKKVPRWECKMCGEKQSLRMEFGRGDGPDCRRHVQKLSELQQYRDSKLSDVAESWVNDDSNESMQHQDLEQQPESPVVPRTSKWASFVKKNEADDQPEVTEKAKPCAEHAERSTQREWQPRALSFQARPVPSTISNLMNFNKTTSWSRRKPSATEQSSLAPAENSSNENGEIRHNGTVSKSKFVFKTSRSQVSTAPHVDTLVTDLKCRIGPKDVEIVRNMSVSETNKRASFESDTDFRTKRRKTTEMAGNCSTEYLDDRIHSQSAENSPQKPLSPESAEPSQILSKWQKFCPKTSDIESSDSEKLPNSEEVLSVNDLQQIFDSSDSDFLACNENNCSPHLHDTSSEIITTIPVSETDWTNNEIKSSPMLDNNDNGTVASYSISVSPLHRNLLYDNIYTLDELDKILGFG